MLSDLSTLLLVIGLITLITSIFHLSRYIYMYFIYSSNPILNKYRGDWAIITGGSQGIGAGYAHELASRGINLILIARDMSKLEVVTTEIRDKYKVEVDPISFDFCTSDMAAYNTLFDRIHAITTSKDKSSSISIVINNVGGTTHSISSSFQLFTQQSPKQLMDVTSINLLSTAFMLHHYIRIMQQQPKGGIVINVSSASGTTELPFQGIYPACKAAINTLTVTLATEIAYAQKQHQPSSTTTKGDVLIETHVPAEVITSSNASHVTLNAPTGITWAKSSCERIGAFSLFYGSHLGYPYLPHALSIGVLQLLPYPLCRIILTHAVAAKWKQVTKQE